MTDDLFSDKDGASRSAPTDASTAGLVVTNHLNLMYMLGVGLVVPPAGFGGRYYKDTLGCFPGWIPLFLGRKVPRDALALSTREAAHLRPIVVEMELGGLSGTVATATPNGMRELHFPDQLDGTERVLLIPAPLPTARIKHIVFASPDDKGATEADALDFDNVPLRDFKRKTTKTLFTKPSDAPWPPEQGPTERVAPLQAPLAAGGAMAMLAHFGNQGDLAVDACRAAFDPDDRSATPVDATVLAGLPVWIRSGRMTSSSSTDMRVAVAPRDLQNTSQESLFRGAVDRLVDWRNTDLASSAEDALLDYLEKELTALDPRLQAGARQLRDTLVSLTGIGTATASELFVRHKAPFARAMILFFLRDRCTDLLEFSSGELHEPDWLVAAVLFGARDGWLSLPLPLRTVPGLSAAVSERMAQMAHRIARTDIDMGTPSPRFSPLRELFRHGAEWSSRQARAAEELVRCHDWDCASTRISLGPGSYQLVVERGSLHIDLSGEPNISRIIDRERFFHLLASAPMDRRVEASVRKTLSA